MKKLVLSLLLIVGCGSSYPPLEVVEKVDLNKYLGKWYEIASFPNSFQKDCNCTTAEYTLPENHEKYIIVKNSCNRKSPDGKLSVANGKAFIADDITNAKLKVQFFWPFKGDYYIIDLADDYSYVLVGHPSREYLWILAREKTMLQETYNHLQYIAEQKGFDVTKLVKTNQNCD